MDSHIEDIFQKKHLHMLSMRRLTISMFY